MKCPEARQLFSAYLDGELAPDRAEALRRHLDECRACAAELELDGALSTALRESAEAAPAAPSGFAGGVTAAIAAERRRTAGRPAGVLGALGARWRHGLAAAAAFLLIVTASLGYGMQQWLSRGPLVAVDPPDNTGQTVDPTGVQPGSPGAGEPGGTDPGRTPGGGSGAEPGAEEPGTEPGAGETEPGEQPDGEEPDGTAGGGTEREDNGGVQIAGDPGNEPKVFLNKPRTISRTFVRLDVADLDQTRQKALAAAQNHGATGQVQGAASGMTLRFDVAPERADAFVTRLCELGQVAHRQNDNWEITSEFAAALEEYEALTARRQQADDPDERAALDERIASLERKLTEWNQDAEQHIVVLMLQEN